MRAYLDGVILPVSEALPYFDSKIVGTDAGDKVVNPRFEIGRVSDSVVKELERFIDEYGGKQKVLRVSGRSFKHIYEQRGQLARHIVENLEAFFLNNPEVFPDHQHIGKKALLAHAGDDTSKGKHYVAAVEAEVNGDYLDIVSMMTMPGRTLHKAEELKQSWPEGQRLPDGNSPHHVAPCGAHAEADSTDVQPTLA